MIREEHSLGMSVNKVTGRIIRPKTEVTVGLGIVHY